MATSTVRSVLFGPYAVDLRSGELRKHGVRIKLGEQPLQILLLLLERPGEVVTREELRARLWAEDTFVDFEHSLNSAVQRLRDCLSDTAGKPRWVETVPRRGYRFIGQVEWPEEPVPQARGCEPAAPAILEPVRSPLAGQHWVPRLVWIVLAGLCLMLWPAFKFAHNRFTPQESRSTTAIRSLAVLPLENLSGDPAQDYFADGMTDELITMLAKNPRLRVISRTSVMRYRKSRQPLPAIAQELGVDGILEGSVARKANRVHVTAQLIHAGTDTHVWAESYDRDLRDVYSLQDELARTIARQVGVTAALSEKPQRSINPQAHDAYLLGRYYWFSSQYDKSQEYFQKAIDLQPDYAAAWSGLSDSYVAKAVEGEAPPGTLMPQGEAAARRALELDDSLAEAHNSMAAAYYFDRWDWSAAEAESARAVALNPSFAEAHHLRSYILSTLNHKPEALQEERKAMELDPFARPWALARTLLQSRQFDAALHEARLRSEAQPDNASLHEQLLVAYWHKGMRKEAVQEWETFLRLEGKQDSALAVDQAFRRGGLPAVFEWRLSELRKQATTKYVSPFAFANVYACLRRKDETLSYLEKAYQGREPWLVHLQDSPNFDFLHSELRYQSIVKKMGLPAAP
ncbi:MAG: winged helix-turn-helix domain-containing tetratricopeptide repeat protein [Chlamydiota bacterium]